MTPFRLASAALLATTALSAPAAAQTLTSDIEALQSQIAEQDQRISELEEQQGDLPSLSTDVSGVTLTFGGRINAMVLYADQGGRDQSFIADNDGSGSRFEFLAESRLNDQLAAGLEIVVSAEVNSSDNIDFGSTLGSADEDGPAGDFRQAHFYVDSSRFGYISFGQGDTAAEDTAHADLSGTAFAGAGSDVDDIAGGLHFHAEDDSDLGELDDYFDMLDGTRTVRALYITPEFSGFSVGISAASSGSGSDGDDDVAGSGLQPAVGLYYEDELAFGEISASASWRREVFDDTPDGEEVEDTFLVASGSVLLNSGFNVTLAAAQGDIDGRDEDDTAYFGKLGYIIDMSSLGETRFSIDYYRGENQPEFGAPNDDLLSESDNDLVRATSYGLFAVQEISDLNAEFYVGYRNYELDDVYLGGAETDVDNMSAVLAGARIRF